MDGAKELLADLSGRGRPIATEGGRAKKEPRLGAENVGGPNLRITIKIVSGPITTVKAPIAVVGRYLDTPPAGASKEFDKKLHCCLTRAHEAGMIGSRLGELFYVPLAGFKRERTAPPNPRDVQSSAELDESAATCESGTDLAPDGLIVAGMGEPGRFGSDDLQYLMTNVTLAVQALGHDEFSTMLLGSHRAELKTECAVRSLVEGVAEGLSRLPEESGWPSIVVLLVQRTKQQGLEIEEALEETRRRNYLPPDVQLEFTREPATQSIEPSGACDPPPADLPPEERTTKITIVRPQEAALGADAVTLEYAAMAETAVVPIRRVQIQRYFAEYLPVRLPAYHDAKDQQRFGQLLANYLMPAEFRQLVEEGDPLTLILDPATAAFPWEMASFQRYGRTCFLGTDLKLTRQFRTQLSPAPALSPPLNHSLKVLVVSDPAPGEYGLRGARSEGLAVLQAFRDLAAIWKGKLDLQVDIRIGPSEDWKAGAPQEVRDAFDALDAFKNSVTVEPCDPIEILSLLVSERYDVVHFCGHGVFEPASGRRGWLLRGDCVLSASEIFQARHVPRLVFANACHSGKVSDGNRFSVGPSPEQLTAQVGLAEAFFARGVENYLGTGWEVNDVQASTFARRFYSAALGLRQAADGTPSVKAPPMTLGDALADARRSILGEGTTWAAYQHYGRVNAKLLAVRNQKAEDT